jgi:phospholipase C
MHTGQKVALQQINFEQRDMAHYYQTAVMDINGGAMNGFDQNAGADGSVGAFAYSYLNPAQVAPYLTMAHEYVLADHMFPTILGPSYTAHLSLIAGQADVSNDVSEANVPSSEPWGCDSHSGTISQTVNTARVVQENGPFPCFTQFRTMADTLDAKHVSWRYYAPLVKSADPAGWNWSAFDSIRRVRYGPDWKNVIAPPQKVLTDVSKGGLAQVSWVIPDEAWSDHPTSGTDYGPSWVANVVDAIGESKYWNSTAIVVLWDDWGGWFDNVPPPQLDYRGLGIRVGCIIISPYVRPHVSHTQYEFGSILRFVEQTFGLPRLGSAAQGYTDMRSASILDSFTFTRKPMKFKPITAPYPRSFFLNFEPSLRAPDDE